MNEANIIDPFGTVIGKKNILELKSIAEQFINGCKEIPIDVRDYQIELLLSENNIQYDHKLIYVMKDILQDLIHKKREEDGWSNVQTEKEKEHFLILKDVAKKIFENTTYKETSKEMEKVVIIKSYVFENNVPIKNINEIYDIKAMITLMDT